MPAFLSSAFQDARIRSTQLTKLQKRLDIIYDSRYTIFLLLALGIVRTLLFLLAYPPAHGADHLDYYLHAAFLSGINVPSQLANTVPLYPVLIAVLNYGLGNFNLIFGVQLAMSAIEGTLYYVGLRRYSPGLAFISALVIMGDPQTGILYNFTQTEPVYLFLLAVTVCLLLIQCRKPRSKRAILGDGALGAVLFALTITRTVGRYLYLPLGIIFVLGTRDWRRSLVLIAGFLVTSFIFNTLYQARIDALVPKVQSQSAGGVSITNQNEGMIANPLLTYHLLRAENGPASAEMVETLSVCAKEGSVCIYDRLGGQAGYLRLLNSAYIEMIRARSLDYAQIILNEVGKFLSMSGQQFTGSPTPVEAQCTDMEQIVLNATNYYVNSRTLLGVANLNRDTLENTIRDLEGRVCPPTLYQPGVQKLVDALALRYRSLGRPEPYLWYGALIVLVAVIPWARRLWLPMITAGVILMNHAAISALLVNVQPRYVAVTNASRTILLLMLLYIIALFTVRIVDQLLYNREQDQSA